MTRFIILMSILLFFLSNSEAEPRISQTDLRIFQQLREYAQKHHLSEKTPVERIPIIARFFIGTPYKSNTLNATKEELPVINLHELDCVTFVENVLAFSFLSEYSDISLDTFIRNITKIRYRHGEITDYTSRLHYSSDWLYEMGQQGFLTDITQFAGGIIYHPDVWFMSRNADRYPPLKQEAELLRKMEEIETKINQRTYYYIPKGKINEAYNKIKNGDIILITTNIKGLDTSHIGFAWKENGKTYLIHASSKGKKVMITEVPLQDYMEGISSQTGIMVARAVKRLL